MSDYRDNPNGWNTYIDIDFSNIKTQTFTTDAEYSIAGHVWSKTGSLNDNAFSKITTSSLEFQSVNNVNWLNQTRTAPGLLIKLEEIYPEWNVSDGFRIWTYEAQDTETSTADFCMTSLTNTYSSTDFMMSRTYMTGVNYLRSIVTKNNVSSIVESAITLGLTNRVRMFEVPDILQHRMKSYYGSYTANGWPALKDLNIHTVINPGTTTNRSSDGSSFYGFWHIIFGGGAVTAATSSIHKISRIRIDALRRY